MESPPRIRRTLLFLAAAAMVVPAWAAERSLPAPVCPAESQSARPQALPGAPPPPTFVLTPGSFQCGSCSGVCAGLWTGNTCQDENGTGPCIGLVNGTRPQRCAPPDTGNMCWCASTPPDT